MKRILWNRRPANTYDCGDIDEIVIEHCTVHIEQMGDRCWWIGIDLDGGGYWAGNFAIEDGRLTFSEQEIDGFEWDEDDTHEANP